jgi:hypothetical protein
MRAQLFSNPLSSTALTTALVLAMVLSGCANPSPGASSSGDPATWLPSRIGDTEIQYLSGTVEERANPLIFDEQVLVRAGLDPDLAQVTTGAGRNGFTVIGIRVPGISAERLVQPMVRAGKLEPVDETRTTISSHPVTILRLPDYTNDTAYLVPVADTLVVVLSDNRPDAIELINGLPQTA